MINSVIVRLFLLYFGLSYLLLMRQPLALFHNIHNRLNQRAAKAARFQRGNALYGAPPGEQTPSFSAAGWEPVSMA